MKNKMICMLMIFTISFPLLLTPVQAETQQRAQGQCFGQNAIDLYSEQRREWKNHVFWTKSYVVSALGDLKDKDATLKRLLQNQVDLGNTIKPFYGEAAGNQLSKLLTEHIVIAGKLVDALKKGDQASAQKLNADWYRNADDIAKFMSKINPNWKEKKMKDLLYMHLKLLTDQVAARLKGDWEGEIKAFDAGEKHILVLADTITNGIMKQFPRQFR
ncbi:glycosyltransferase [Fictibacillus barbaricus]|uniref:Glycosyltransferase n=1 Tax=Fictibacillus barbaricus TaxID=182136 RepID=A0ABU1U3G1_9BACL|nr:glycosyltransferase [Fictibacillus barbaricus]MDR7074003.1 hypothetical protein [Fictibacillus barbaricus]